VAAIKHVLVVLILITAATACRDRSDRDGTAAQKPTETSEPASDGFDQRRDSFETDARERLAQIDARIRELSERGTAKAEAAAEELRVQRDRLAKELDEARDQARPQWEQLETEVSSGLDDLERRLDAAYDAFTR